MKELSMDDVLERLMKEFFEDATEEMIEGIDSVEEEIDELVGGCFLEVDNYSQDANNIFALVGIPLSNGKRFSLNANLIWDEEKEAWISFYDGNGPNDSYFEPDPEGGYRIVWMD